jgi:uncharacterized protein (TIGR02145 family)
MKKISTTIASLFARLHGTAAVTTIVAVALAVGGCSKEDPAPSLEVSPATVSVAREAGTHAVAVASNVAWTAAVSADAAWCTVSPEAGSGDGTVTVTVAANPSAAPRAATLAITAGGTPAKTVTITQAAATPRVATGGEVQASGAGGAYPVPVTGNLVWTAAVNAGTPWCTLEPSPASGSGDGSFTIHVEANPTILPREATVTLVAGVLVQDFIVIQAEGPVTLTVADMPIDAPDGGGNYSIEVAGNDAWTASTDAAWCTVSPAAGNGSATATATVAANPTITARSATVTFVCGDITRVVSLSQAATAPAVSTNLPTVEAIADAGTYPLEVTSNVAWTAALTDVMSWCTVEPASGDAGSSGVSTTTMTVTLAANPGPDDRRAEIVISGAGAPSRSIPVVQRAPIVGDLTFTNFVPPPTAAPGETWTLKDDRDDQEYIVKKMADNRYWMVQDLLFGDATATYADITREGYVGKLMITPQAATIGRGAGYLYNWFAAMNSLAPDGSAPQGICPAGWHLPTSDEFRALFTALRNDYENVGYTPSRLPVIDNDPMHWHGVFGGQANASGRVYTSYFGYYWSSTPSGTANAIMIQFNDEGIYYSGLNREYGLSVRCVRNQ